MAKAAFVCWEDRIAPVFDSAREILIVEMLPDRQTRETREALIRDQPYQTVLRIAELQPDLLVCGAISGYIRDLLTAYDVQIMPFVSGDLRQIIDAWKTNRLKDRIFSMPGCGFQRRGHGRGRTGGQRHGSRNGARQRRRQSKNW